MVDGGLARGVPAEGGEDIGDGLNSRKGEAEPVSLIGEAGEHPGAAGLAKGEGTAERTFSIDIDVHFLGVERLAGGVEKGVDNLFGLEPTWGGRGEEGGGFAEAGIGGALVSVGVEDEAGEGFERIVLTNEFMAKPAEKSGMAGRGFLPVTGSLDDAPAHELRPEPVGHDLGEAFVLGRGDEGGEQISGVGGTLGDLVADVGIEEFFEGPGGRDA